MDRDRAIQHGSASVPFPVVEDLATLIWCINLGCIDFNQWYARKDDAERPDYVHFDLDPGDGARSRRCRETAMLLDETLRGSACQLRQDDRLKGHPRLRADRSRPQQKEVWNIARIVASSWRDVIPS